MVKGVVCKKNVAHRRMTSKIDKARLLILGGALEYQRVSNHLSSFDTLLQQVQIVSSSFVSGLTQIIICFQMTIPMYLYKPLGETLFVFYANVFSSFVRKWTI